MKFFVIVALLLGLSYCVKSEAAPLSYEQKIQNSIYKACANKWGMSTDEEVHATASCVCSINAGLNLGLYRLAYVGSDLTIEKAPEEGPSVYASEDDLLDDML